ADTLSLHDALPITVSFHESVENAQDGVGAIINTTNYTNNSNPQTIYVRIENEIGCFIINEFPLIVYSYPEITDPLPLEICDDNNDGFGVFNLTSSVDQITLGNPNTIVTFHYTTEDAFYGANAIETPSVFHNNSPNHQIIYVRVTSLGGICPVFTTLDLYVHLLPEITDPLPLEMCDDDYDGFVGFNLSSVNQEVLGTLNPLNYEISFFATQEDANANTNEIVNITDYVNLVIHEDMVW